MSYRDDLEAAVSLNDVLRSELDQAKAGCTVEVVKKRGFASRYPTLITLLVIAGYLFTAGMFYTAWCTPHIDENRDELNTVKTGVLSLIWPVTVTYKFGALVARKIVGHNESKRSSRQ